MPCTSQPKHRFQSRQSRGVVLIVVLVAIGISLTLFGLWGRNIVREHRQLVLHRYRMQAARLAEAGVRRAVARRAADPGYQQETWPVPADHLGGTHAAQVEIRAARNDADNSVRLFATAQYPIGAKRSVTISRQIELTLPPPENEP